MLNFGGFLDFGVGVLVPCVAGALIFVCTGGLLKASQLGAI